MIVSVIIHVFQENAEHYVLILLCVLFMNVQIVSLNWIMFVLIVCVMLLLCIIVIMKLILNVLSGIVEEKLTFVSRIILNGVG